MPGARNSVSRRLPTATLSISEIMAKLLFPAPKVHASALTELPCPTCGGELTFLEQYQRYYCLRCQRYAPEGYGARGAKRCPTCGGVLSYVAQYDRFFCYRCNAYATQEVSASPAEEAKPAEPQPAKETPPAEPAAAPATPVETPVAPTAEEAKSVEPATPAAAPGPSTQAATPAATPPVAPTEAPAQPTPAPATAPPEEIPPAKAEEPAGMGALQPLLALKPAALRVKLFTLKKTELMGLCKAFNMEPTGTKEQMQDRLLNYLHDLEAEEAGEEEPAAAAPSTPKPAAPGPTAEPASAETKSAEPAVTPSAAVSAPEASAVVVLEEPKEVARVEEPTPAVVAVPTSQRAVEETPVEPRVAHPCPTCGRELSYISQYERWYCYFCQRYSPKVAPKFACPTCGSTLRWIGQYQRWWCDNCQKYAPSDLPRPRSAAASAAPATAVAAMPSLAASTSASTATVSVHRHGNPMSGVGLIVFGIILFVLNAVVYTLPPLLNYDSPVILTPSEGVLLDFAAFLLVAVGAILGFAAVRHRA